MAATEIAALVLQYVLMGTVISEFNADRREKKTHQTADMPSKR